MSVDTSHSILRSARSFFAGTALSRISGLFREVAMAFVFGTSSQVAAFMVSYRLANLFRRLLGEGNLQAGFTPHFVALKERGAHFYRDVTVSLSALLFFIILLLEGILWSLCSVVGDNWIEIVTLTMWMAPGLFFISLYGLNSALLQCRKKYFLPAAAPVVFNFIWIAAVLFVPDVRFLSIAITVAFAGQWFITFLEGMRLLSFKEWLTPQWFSPEFRALLKPLILGIMGIGAVQFNSALDAIFARFADLQGPSFLWYAIRIQQLPLALFGVALSGALLPPLSKTEDPVRKNELLQSALRHSATLMLVSTFGLLALGKASVNLLFAHGNFDSASVEKTCHCLWGYSLGLVPSVFVFLLATRLYAEKDYRTPMTASLFSVGANISLNALFVFVFNWGAVSIAIATSLSSFFNMALLAKGAFTAPFCRFFAKMTFVSFFPAAATLAIAEWTSLDFPQLPQFVFLSALYLGGVLILAWRLKLTELFELLRDC